METSLFNRLQLSLLAVATAGLVLLAVLNLRQESQSQVPDDGVWWVEAHGGAGLIADKVLPNSPGQRYGIQAHDLLTAVNDTPIAHVSDLERELYHTGVWSKANYTITRDGIQLDTPVVVIPEPPDRSVPQALRFIGLIYLAIGVYVLLPPLDGPARHPLLSFLPGLLCALRARLHRRIRPARLDRFLDRTRRRSAPTRALPPFRTQLPRRTPQGPPPPLAVAACLCAGRGSVRPVVDGFLPLAGHRNFSSIASTRPAPPTMQSFTSSPRFCSCAATAGPTLPCCASS